MEFENLARDGYVISLEESQLKEAIKYNITPDMDYIFRATYEYYKRDFDFSVKHYYLNGHTSAERVRDMASSRMDIDKPARRLLDFASGYGCVSRHLKNIFPGGTAVPMDIHDKAYWFNRQNLGLEGIVSSANPAEADAKGQYDIVFALSFFSHMPDRTFGAWLQRLVSFVAPGGLLIFTAHGRTSHQTQMPHIEVNSDGHGFIRDSEQFDLSTDDYGHAVTYEPHVRSKLEHIPGVKLLDFVPGIWWNHQDAYVLRRT